MRLKELTYIKSITGYEKKIREIIKDEISSYTESVKEDNIGNIIDKSYVFE